MHYLDHAATTPVSKNTADVIYRFLVKDFGNPSSQYPFGRAARTMVEQSRSVVAQALGCAPNRLVFNSCGSEGDNWAISLAVRQGRHTGRHIITTATEHSAVLEPCKLLAQDGHEITYLLPDRHGNITAEQVSQALRPDTVLVSIMMVNSETGCIYPIHEITRLLKERNSPALFHTDAVQGFLRVPFSADRLGADMITISGHKIGAPKGIGAIYLGPRVRTPRPWIAGGGQEMGLRSGTEATAQIAGFAAAVSQRYQTMNEDIARMCALRDYARDKLLSVEGIVAIGNGTAPHIITVSLVGYPSSNVINELGRQGICISAGSACHRGKLSHVYTAMKLDRKIANGALRISIGPESTREDIDALVSALRQHRDTRFPTL